VDIYDVLGHKIISLVNKNQTAGWHAVSWKGTNKNGVIVPAGMYLGVISSKSHREMIKLMYVK